MDKLEVARVIRSLIVALPVGSCVGIGVAIQNKLKAYFNKKENEQK